MFSEDMGKLDSLTTAENLEAYKKLYMDCVNRDTPLNGSMEGVRTEFTVD